MVLSGVCVCVSLTFRLIFVELPVCGHLHGSRNNGFCTLLFHSLCGLCALTSAPPGLLNFFLLPCNEIVYSALDANVPCAVFLLVLFAPVPPLSEKKLFKISQVNELPNNGAHIPVVQQAEALMRRLEMEQRANTLLDEAMQRRDLNALANALAGCDRMNPPLVNAKVEKARKMKVSAVKLSLCFWIHPS